MTGPGKFVDPLTYLPLHRGNDEAFRFEECGLSGTRLVGGI